MNNSKPITHKGKKLFPFQRFLNQLSKGDMFKTKYNPSIYTVGENQTIKDDEGREAYYPERMPVILLKEY
jgi:hypothetical protein